jgi:hypothetical protein
MSKVEYSQSDDGTQKYPTYSPEMQKLVESYIEETYSLSKPVKKEVIE